MPLFTTPTRAAGDAAPPRPRLLMPMPLGYQTKWIDQPHDHFRFGAEAAAPWQQRYLFNDTFWDGRGALSGRGGALSGDACRGPILFYTGNEVSHCSPLRYTAARH
mgnify:CR=1 FL=1